MKIAQDSMRGKRREIPPAAERIMKPGRLYLSDNPENQMGMSIISECHKRFPDREEAQNISLSFIFRWFALGKARNEGKLEEFAKPGDEPGAELINSAVFEVAAICPLKFDGSGGFDDSYIERVRKMVVEAREN